QQRAVAPALQQGLQALKAQIKNGRRDYATLFEQFKTDLQAAGFRLDYVELRDALSLQPAAKDSTQLVLLAAAYLGSTRLIDNLIFDL
ncbi:MAG: pantoate--beta-alanine ligase, partial [Pseudomonas sp.]